MAKRYAIIDTTKSTPTKVVFEDGPEYRSGGSLPTALGGLGSEYFDEFVKAGADQILQGSWVLYDGLTSELDLSEAEIPTEPFRLAITVSPATGHTTAEGTVHIDDEELEFTGATRLTNVVNLAVLPDISTEGLDCNILIECISTTGEPLYHETLVPIKVVVFPKTRVVPSPHGSSGYQETNYNVYSDAPLKIGDQIRYTDPHQGTSIDIYVKDVSSAVDLEDNTQPFRVFYCA